MKNIFKYLAVMAMSVALTGLVACDPEPDPEPTPDTYTESTTYAIIYEDNAVAAGTTLVYNPSDDEIRNGLAVIHLLLENKTSETVSTVMIVEKTEGPAAMDDLMICFNEDCNNPTAPWTSSPFTLEPGVNYQMPISFDYNPSKVTSKTTYRVSICKSGSLEDPQVIFINVND